MITIHSSWGDVEALVNNGIEDLNAEKNLFRLRAHERSITHRLACHLDKYFEGWDVDCEYNRIGESPVCPKRLFLPNDKDEVFNPSVEEKLVNPDIVIHHRGKNDLKDNLLVIEVKTTWSTSDENHDINKLNAFCDESNTNQQVEYRYGLFLKFDEKGDVQQILFANRAGN